jgi:acyl-CoA thioesterase
VSDKPSAAQIVAALMPRDAFAKGLGLEVLSAEPGRASVRLRVTAAHLNFYGYCHGGVIFTLADEAFGLASNVYGERAVLLDAQIAYTSAARAGDELTATAGELSRTRRTALYRVEVRNGAGALVGQATGTAYLPGKPVLPLTDRP